MAGNRRQFGTATQEGITIDASLKMVVMSKCTHCNGRGTITNSHGFPGSPENCEFCDGDGELITGKIYEVI